MEGAAVLWRLLLEGCGGDLRLAGWLRWLRLAVLWGVLLEGAEVRLEREDVEGRVWEVDAGGVFFGRRLQEWRKGCETMGALP